ncbi:MAG TPA: serine/threonine-protein kinase [Pyrinomonadaceae bacterium]
MKNAFLSSFILHPSSFLIMTPERWQKVEDLLHGALDRPAHERASFLNDACAGDPQLKDEATSLIEAYDEAGDFIEQSALAQDARVLVADSDSKIGCSIGVYRIIERLGVGGMGEVYLAEDARLDRLVALKILPAYFASDDSRLRRFQREARAASALNHPNILTIHEVGESDDIYFIATEFIDGQTIRELAERQALKLGEVLDIGEQIASGLAAAHAAGIVHRDIKPENIMRRTDGLVKILDFGIAKLMEPDNLANVGEAHRDARTRTEAGLVMGTVSYMSPEQARALPVDERTDIWSLGVVLYEMLAGRLPFTGTTRMDTMVAILDREPAPLCQIDTQFSESFPLQRIVSKCLRKEMIDRYGSATELLSDLRSAREQLNSGLSHPAQLVVRAKTAQSPVRFSSSRSGWAALGAVLLLIATLTGTMLYRRSELQRRSSLSIGPVTTKLYSQMSEAERLNFVDVQEQRISTMMGDRPLKLNEDAVRVIKGYVDQLAAGNSPSANPRSRSMNEVYARAQLYVPLIARSFAERKVPIIIGIYLPVIESAYQDCYENSIGAKGLFQFLPQTAESYGVSRQEMCDAEKMTPAAAHYIADRMAELGEDSQSVTLVLLSYNRGPEWVRNTLRELRGTKDYERNFWTLFANREKLDDTFRNENAGYVPSFFAAAIIGENPQTFGLPQAPLSTLAGEGGRQ